MERVVRHLQEELAVLQARLLAMGGFAVGFLVRPLGALVFGRLGDLIGRKYSFLATLLLMAASTFCIGILPSHELIGVLAPVALNWLWMFRGAGARRPSQRLEAHLTQGAAPP